MEIPLSIKCCICAALSAFSISSCATITTGTDQGIEIVTEKDIIGASCTLEDSKGNRSFIPRTPGTTYITRGNAPLIITCAKPGFKTTTLVIDEKVAGATFGNIILGGGIGIIFDASSGAAQRYPDKVVIWMEPEEWPDENARLQWEKERHAYIEESKSAARDKTFSGTQNEFE
jgi:hypothetical protein